MTDSLLMPMNTFYGIPVFLNDGMVESFVKTKRWKRPGRPYAGPKFRWRCVNRPSRTVYDLDGFLMMHPVTFNRFKNETEKRNAARHRSG